MSGNGVVDTIATRLKTRWHALWRPDWAEPRVAGTVGLLCVIVCALTIGYQVDLVLARHRDHILVADITQSLDHVATVAVTNRDRLGRLVGQPCERILADLYPTDLITPYVRQITFVQHNIRYCSTIAGIDSGNMPAALTSRLTSRLSPRLTSQLKATSPQQWPVEYVRFTSDSALTPGTPLLQIYNRSSDDGGLLYVIEGRYIADFLASGAGFGSANDGADGYRATVSARDGGTLGSHGAWEDSAPWSAAERLADPGRRFAVTVVRASSQRHTELLATESITMVVCLLLYGVVWLGYLAGFTPGQRLKRQVALGLRRGEFYVVYQPVVDTDTGKWRGAEALLRWNHPRFGPVAPGRFIRDIETTSLIVPLTRFVLSTALNELGSLRLPEDFRISVNVAPCHIGMPSFCADILRARHHGERHAFSKMMLVLEVTERGLLAQSEPVRRHMAQLREHGIEFAIDDFGIENSNLTMLQGFSFHYLKMDKAFIDDVVDAGRGLIEGVMMLASRLGLEVVAEGIETEAQRAALRDIGVPFGQGYLFARPMLVADFERELTGGEFLA